MLCGNCGHDNPRENRYCGMCGTPFPHRLTIPDEQSALAFSSTPITVTPSALPISAVEPPRAPAMPSMTTVQPEEPSPLEGEPPSEPLDALVTESTADTAAAVPAVELPLDTAPPPLDAPIEPTPVPVESEAYVEPEATAAASAVEISEEEPEPVVEEFAPSPAPASPPPPTQHEDEIPAVVASTAPSEPLEPPSVAEEPAPPPQPASHEVAPIPNAPEVVEPVAPPPPPPHAEPVLPPRAVPPARIETPDRKPTVIRRPPAPQPIASPPPSAGMPTFRSVAEASGTPVASSFDPDEPDHSEEERDLREYVAAFRYTPPDEAFDELTMRSEVPVLENEAPAMPSHPSFDDDVPPPPEAGSVPTGAEYYQPAGPAPGRPRFIDIAEASQPSPGRDTTARTGTSFLGLDTPPPAPPPLDEAAEPSRSRWPFWSSLAAALLIFGGLGFLEGRAQINHTNRGPVELLVQQFQKLRQRGLTSTVKAPAAPSSIVDKEAAEAPQSAELQAKSPTTVPATTATNNLPPSTAANSESGTSPAPQAPVTTEQQQPAASASSSTPPQNSQTTPAAPVTAEKQKRVPASATPTNPASASADAKREAAKPLEAPTPPSGSKHDPGQQELDKAMQAGDPTAAAAWLWKATSRGNPDAPVRLADMYIKGKGVPRSCEQALVLLRSAATKENAPARNRLAALYANGSCVARDRVKAYQLMSSALVADPGSEWARQSREELWQQMTPSERILAAKYR